MTAEQAKALESNPLWQAFKAGKQLQWKSDNDHWRDVGSDLNVDTFSRNPDRIRLKPIPVPPGDLTWEEAERLAKEGKAVECSLPVPSVVEWTLAKLGLPFPRWLAYRLKPELKRVPLTESDLPGQPFWMKRLERGQAFVPSVDSRTCGGVHYDVLAASTHRYSLDLNLPWKQWKPFYKEI